MAREMEGKCPLSPASWQRVLGEDRSLIFISSDLQTFNWDSGQQETLSTFDPGEHLVHM